MRRGMRMILKKVRGRVGGASAREAGPGVETARQDTYMEGGEVDQVEVKHEISGYNELEKLKE